MVSTHSHELWQKMWAYKDHGKSHDAVYHRQHPAGFRWLHESFGTNWRMTEMQAVIGRIQLKRLPEWTAKRQAHAATLAQVLSEFDFIRLQTIPEDIEHAQYKFYAFVRPERLPPNWNRDGIIEALNAQGIPCYQGSCSEVYLEKAFDNTDFRPTQRLSNAVELGETSLMFLVHPSITDEQIRTVADGIRLVLSQI